MMPRRISLAPPRSENDGACIMVCASTAMNACVDFAIRLLLHQLARDFRDFLLDHCPDILHQRRLQRGVLTGLQHAGHRPRQPPQA